MRGVLPGDGRRRALAGLLLVTLAAWLPALRAGFVWDDVPLVVRNRLLAAPPGPETLRALFTADLWDGAPVGEGVSGYYRPLMLLSLALDRWLWGLSPAGHHAQDLAWHLLATAALYRFAARLAGWRPALLAGAIFALHPVQAEAVAWVAARNDPMAMALGLLALDAVVGRDRPRWVAAFAWTFLAGLAKESVLLLPLLAVVLDLGWGRRPAWRGVAAMAAGIAGVVALRALAGVGAVTLPAPSGWLLLARRAGAVLAWAGASLLDPAHLSIGRSIEWLDREPPWRVALGGLAVAGLGALLLPRRTRPRVAASLAWAALVFLPSLVPLADKGQLGERYLYPSLAGLGLAVGLVAGRHAAAAAIVFALPAVIFVQLRLPDWHDDLALWSSAVRASPNPYAWAGLGHALRAEHRDGEALAAFRAAVDDPLPDLTACPRLVGTALAIGRPRLAAELGDLAVSRGCRVDGGDPTAGVFAGQYAVALAFAGRWDDAAAVVERAVPDPEGRLVVARAALALRAGDEATVAALEAGWSGAEPLRDQARKVLEGARRLAGEAPGEGPAGAE